MTPRAIPFGHYYLLERLAVGGMAEVYLAKSADAAAGEKLVAVKRILPNIAEDKEFVAMFVDEAKIAGQLNHGNIARIYDLGKIHASYFIAMEYVPGPDLRSIWDQSRDEGRLPLALICYVVMKLCDGLDYAHRRHDTRGRPLNIIHRDVSPQNVLVSYDGDIKIIDFGIAKAANRAVKTQTGILKGKFAYMAPEQARGEAVDHRVDIFAAGVILYELCTGERLYKADSDFALLDKVRKVDITPPAKINPDLAGQMERIILRALAPRVEERYSWASLLRNDVQRYMDDHGLAYSREELAEYVRETFFEDYRLELERLNEYQQLDVHALGDAEGDPLPPPPADPGAPKRETTPVGEATLVNPSPFEGAEQSEAETVLDQHLHKIAASFRPPPDDEAEQTREDEAGSEITLTRDRPPPAELTDTDGDQELDDNQEDAETSLLPPFSQEDLAVEPPTFLDPELIEQGARPRDRGSITFPSGLHAIQAEAGRPLVTAAKDSIQASEGEAPARASRPPTPAASGPFNVATMEVHRHADPAAEPVPRTVGVRRSADLDFVPSRWPLAISFLVGVVAALLVVLLVAYVGLGNEGHLVVITEPRDTEVEVDGQRLGERTPLQLSLEAGAHDIRLRRPGIAPVEKAITISREQVILLDEVMPRGKASLKITSDPDGAAVAIDGKSVGTTPFQLGELPADEPLTVELTHTLTRPWTERITLQAGETREMAPTLAYKSSRVRVQPTPDDSVVYWDKRWRRAWIIQKVPWGSSHELKVSRPGCENHEQEVVPAGEEELVLEPVLTCRPFEEGGSLTVTGPRPGRIFLDGTDVGRLPLRDYRLPAGIYQLEVRGRRDTERRNIQIDRGQKISMRIRVR